MKLHTFGSERFVWSHSSSLHYRPCTLYNVKLLEKDWATFKKIIIISKLGRFILWSSLEIFFFFNMGMLFWYHPEMITFLQQNIPRCFHCPAPQPITNTKVYFCCWNSSYSYAMKHQRTSWLLLSLKAAEAFPSPASFFFSLLKLIRPKKKKKKNAVCHVTDKPQSTKSSVLKADLWLSI